MRSKLIRSLIVLGRKWILTKPLELGPPRLTPAIPLPAVIERFGVTSPLMKLAILATGFAATLEFTDACKALGLAQDRTDPITELVARHIIELAQRGIRNKAALYLRTMVEFKASPQ